MSKSTFSLTDKKRLRKNFGKFQSPAQMPNLLGVQKKSYDGFLYEPKESNDFFYTLDGAFKGIFPMNDTAGIAQLDYVNFEIQQPKFDIDECRARDLTFAAPLRTTLRLTLWETDQATGAKTVKDIKEQDVYLCDIPLMTDNGTFVVNGTERVVVSQMQRSPGVFFDHDKGNTHSSGKLLFSGRIIPFRGSWLDLEFDHKDNIHARIDRRRKMPATIILRALGLSTQDILNSYYDSLDVKVKSAKAGTVYNLQFEPMFYAGVKLTADLIDADSGKAIAESGKKASRRILKKAEEAGTKWIQQEEAEMVGRYLAEAIIDKETGEVLHEAGTEITPDILDQMKELKFKGFKILKIDHLNIGAYIRNTLMIDKTSTTEEALVEIYKVMRPGEPPTVEAGQRLFNTMFFDGDRFDMSAVGRMKMNARLNHKGDIDAATDSRILEKEDIIAVMGKLLEIRDGRDVIDDIDHLGNRRVRLVGELMENQFRIGLLRMERSVKERMGNTEIHTMVPNDLINSRPLSAALREFFAGSQLSQFMDQTNPLSEVTHKRRLSALGPGGLTRERAGFEVRDVHPTHYGRICPIETPEGPNIGLINSLSTYAQINKYGFIETPYRKVAKAKASQDIVYMSAIEEGREVVAQANSKLDAKGNLVEDFVVCRKAGETMLMPKDEVTAMDVSPKQVVSVAAAMIPFLEHDDANRALMGSNMQRQAVPLIKTDAPLVGTGMERNVAQDAGVTTIAKRGGIVELVDATRIVVKADAKEAKEGQSGVDIYRLTKFMRSNQNSCMTQKPLVKQGDKVNVGDIMADGASTDLGELALGRNILVAFMPWNGYNFEDSILISERIVRDDIFTSIHIDEFNTMARDTKLGSEEITRDIPNLGEEALTNIDESGIVRIGADVGPGDILVGKITPKGESPMTPEEKLLRAIFGEKAADVRDTSLRMPPSLSGTVVGVKIFNRRGNEKDERTVEIEEQEIAKLKKDIQDERRIIEMDVAERITKLATGQKAAGKVGDISKGKDITATQVEKLKLHDLLQISVSDDKTQKQLEQLKTQLGKDVDTLTQRFEEKKDKIRQPDDLQPGVLKMVKVFIAIKRKLQPGDKMAGRHGNKGVISKVNPIEDMPYLADGTPVDMVLNPLGVPSRMNVGQILETHLGWAAMGIGKNITKKLEAAKASKSTKELRKYLEDMYEDGVDASSLKALTDGEILEMAGNLGGGMPMACPAFDGPSEDTINAALTEAGIDHSGKVQLYDGRSGDAMEQKTTVGVMYMLKLHHLVDEKIHARSIGPYSLVTQQPLGGKAQFGGQRFGEMEVWALQAYGASYTLQEMLTVKSDDVSGRTKTYEAIVRGETNFEAGIPESFNVLTKEIQALGLNMELIDSTLIEGEATDADGKPVPAITDANATPTIKSVFGDA